MGPHSLGDEVLADVHAEPVEHEWFISRKMLLRFLPSSVHPNTTTDSTTGTGSDGPGQPVGGPPGGAPE